MTNSSQEKDVVSVRTDASGEEEEKEDSKVDPLFTDLVKECVNKALDYTLLVALLVVQFFKCTPGSTEDITYETPRGFFSSLYSCDASQSGNIFYGNNPWINGLVFAAIIISFAYGLAAGAGVWIHAKMKSDEELEIPKRVKNMYEITNKIFVIDTALEIPVSFFLEPIATIILWLFFTIGVIGLILMSILYSSSPTVDEGSKSVFGTSVFLVAFSLFKLTGDISEYWVMYSAAKKNKTITSDDKEDKEKENKEVEEGEQL